MAPSRADKRDLRIRRSGSVPPFSWAAVVDGSTCEVTIGDGVESTDSGVIEGVWAGQFADFEPHRSEFLFGSGVIQESGRIRFLSPHTSRERLYAIRRANSGRAVVSNSLAFALTTSGVDIGSGFFHEVERRLRTRTQQQAAEGVDWAKPEVARHGDLRLFQIMHHAFEIDRAGRPRMSWGAPRRHFSDFASYRRFLTTVASEIIRNGRDPARAHPLSPITTISSGYDSVAVSSLLSQIGVRDALTLDVEVYGRNDSGSAPAQALGLDLESFPHIVGPVIDQLAFSFGPGLAEQSYEFIATSGLGDDLFMKPFEPRLRDTMLFRGNGGDGYWDDANPARPGMPNPGTFSISYTEFRLRVGFVLIALPAAGVRFPAPINELKSSPEMAPYRLGGSYDRSIPRRMAEEAGVPREAFGRAKTAASPLPLNRESLFPVAMAAVMKRYAEWNA
jgi:hypothetical protein